MKELVIVDKITLNKVSLSANRIVLEDASIIQTKLHREDVQEFLQDGNTLIIKLKNGEVITIENFFAQYEDGLVSDLVFEDDECAFLWFDFTNGVASFKEIAGLEVLLPPASSSFGGLVPWLVGGGLVAGGIGLAGGSGGSNSSKPPVERPQVEVSITPDGTIVLTYPKNTDPNSITTDKIIVKDPNGNDIVVDFGTPVTQPDGSITVTGKVPEGTDSTITVTVPEGSYEDTTGNPGQPGTGTGTVDTERPQVEVTVTPNGDIVLTYPDDTDPSTITPDQITVKDPNGKDIVVEFGTPETQPDGSITVTGKVPEGTDSTITVTVPEGSYEDTTGNPGQPGTGTGTVDTERPQVEVSITPDGTIVLTYPKNTDPNSITTDKIIVKDPNGKDIVVDFGTPVTQPDGSITVTGKVPAGVDGTITVTVPEGSYEDTTGNPGVEGQDTTTVDTIAPEVAVTVTSLSADHTSATATFTFTEKIDPATFSTNDLIVTGGKVVGAITQVDEFTWTVELKTEPGVTVSVEVKDDSYSDVAGNTGKGDQDQLITLKITGVTPNTDANGDDITVITGKTEPNSEVSVLVPGQDTPLIVQSGPDGLWELTVPGILKDGNEVSATTTYEDKNGDVVSTGDEVELPFVYIDVIAGDDVINETELADLTETVDGQNFITVTGTISNPAADLVVNFNGTPYSGSQVTVTPQGQWSIRVPVADVKESNTVTAQATTDTATSNTAERQPGLDNQAPSVTVEMTEQGLITIKYESDVNPSTVDVADYTVVDQFGKKVTVEYTVSEDGLTVTGKITSPVDGKVTVLVPKDSYQDFSGNNGTKGSASESVDTTSPTVNVTITPQGEIVVTYEDDVDPKSIDPKDIVVKDPSGNVITVELTPSADGLTYTGQVPEGIDGKVTVSVPTNSYEDLTGNPGKAGTGEGDVDTDRPQVEVTVTPEGQIIVTYPEDTDPTTIDPQDIIVKDPSGNDITVTLTPSDNGLMYTGQVPEGIDGKVTVEVPEGSYEDITGNPGKVGGGEGSVDTDRPQVDVTVTPEGQIIVTYPEDTDPATIDPKDIVVKDPSGNVITVDLTPSEGGLTYTGQVPEGIDGTVTVEVPEGSYEDLTGNPGKLGEGEGDVDTDRPQVEVTVTPEGQIIVEYPTDTDPTSITTDKIVVKDPEGNEITVTLTPSEGGLTYTGQVPEGVDGTVTVEVPDNSYEDLTGNPGKAGEGKGDVDTDGPQVEVTVTPEGQIVVTYPEDTDPTSITTDKIVVKDPEGNEITVTLTPSEGGLTYTGQVPEGIDGTVTVEVPENSYEDLTGNPGKAGEGKGDVDTDRPQVEVTVTPEGQIVVTYPEDTDPTSITTDKIVVKDPEGNEITVTLTPSEGGLTYTGQVPEGIDGTVTVEVPENSYEDLTGNPGKAGEGKGSVDTDRPQVGVEITPNGDIILTYPEDTDPTTIGTSTITVEGPKGPITVEFGTPEVQTDGTVVVTSKVPEGVDGQVTVTVPEGSYEDLTGNPGKVGETQGNVDTDRPSVEITLTPQGSIVIQYEDDVDPTTIDPKDLVITDENGNPIVVEFTVSPDGLTLTGQIPPNVDSKVTVIVPEGSYQDKTGNDGEYDIDSKLVDTDVPEVTVTVDPQGNITVTYPEDTDPKTIKPDAIVVKDPTGKEITVELTPSPDGLTYTAKVPEGIDGKVTVDVPAGSYEDLTGNPGTPSTGKYPVDTIAPTVEITLTPTGDIVVKFEDDVDPKSIDPETIIITDKDGKPIEVTLTPSEDGLTYTGKIPSGVDEQITVEVPTGSYTDLVGNPGVTDKETVDVDTIAPTVTVDIIAQATDGKATATFEFSENIDPESFSSADLKVTGGQVVGQPTFDAVTGKWSVELKVEPGQTVTVEVLPESYTDEAGNKGSGDSDRLITVNIDSVTPNTAEDGTHVTVITGKTEPGHDVVVTLPDGTELPPVKAGPDGTWTTTTELPLKDGDDLSASTTDQDGNPTKDTVSLPLISINVIAGDDVINEEEMAELTDEDGNFIITGTISNPNAAITVDVNGTEYTVDPADITPTGQWTLKVPATEIKPENSITATAKTDTVTSEDAIRNPGLDNDAPTVQIEITPQGEIKVTFAPDVDPATIDPKDFVITGLDGKPVVIDFTPSEDRLTYTGQVPTGVDTSITVKVPEASYSDKAGNPGEEGSETVTVDTAPPVAEVTVTPDGKITITYPDDTNPDTIDTTGIIVEGPDGEVIPGVTFEEQPDGTFTAKVPEGIDGDIVVKVPAGSYEDTTGNSGEPVKQPATVDTESPVVDVQIDENGKITLTYPEDTNPDTIDTTGIVVEGPKGPISDVTFEKQPDGTYTAKVPEGVDGEIVVKVPAGSYEDTTGNSGEPVEQPGRIDTDTPTATVTITPDGKITVTYPDDVDPSTITEESIVVEGPNGPIEVPFIPPVKQPDGSYVVTGEVPEGTDGEIVVKVPAGSYEDTTGNSGEPVAQPGNVDTDTPTAEVTITPDGKITVTYPDDVDPSTITEDKIVVEGPNGPIEVPFTPAVKQPDGSYVVNGEVPEGTDGDIVVKVPAGSYEDTTGNSGEPVEKQGAIDTESPAAEVTIEPNGEIIVTYSPDADKTTIDPTDIVVKDSKGNTIVVDFVPSNDGLTYTGKVPTAIDENITVTVPENSFKDTTGNDNTTSVKTDPVDTIAPKVEVVITPEGQITLKYEDDVVPSTIDTSKIVIVDGNGNKVPVTFTPSENGLTLVGQVPDGIDSKVTVTVPAGSYADEVGNKGGKGSSSATVDTQSPEVEISITPDGKITVTYPDDVNPDSIEEGKIVVEGPNGPIEVPFTPPVKQPDGSYVVTGEVPEGTDGDVTVKVPTDSYEDTLGNPGEEVDTTVPVDTIPPKAEVTVTPDGKITVTYPDDVDPDTITEEKIIVEGPKGPIEVTFTPPVKQPDGSYVVTGEVPPGVDGTVTVTVPGTSYEDESGNPGEPNSGNGKVDTDVPTAIVTIQPNGDIVIKYPEDTNPDSIDTSTITFTDKDGDPVVVELTPSTDGKTFTGKVPNGNDTDITVSIPTGSYTDETGNSGAQVEVTEPVDTIAPNVDIDITPNGQITLTFDDDTVPSTIQTGKITVTDKSGNPIVVEFVPSQDDPLVLVGRVPEGIETGIVVTVPAGSYQDDVGNKGTLDQKSADVDTVPPVAEVTITPDGKITVTYPDDVDSSTITEEKIIVEGPKGPIEVTFTPPVKQPDGSYVVTGEVPPGVDGTVTVTVPGTSYEDESGNPGEPNSGNGKVDTDVPTAIVTIQPNGDIVIKYPDDTNPDSIDTSTITFTDKDGDPVVVELTPSTDGKTFTGKVPNGNDTDITVSIPTGSYTDVTGNPGAQVDVTEPVDTIAPNVNIDITPNGQITLTFDDDTIPSTIQTGKITVTDKSGNPIVVEFVPSQDDPLVLVGRVPEGIETGIVVTVPAGSYQDDVGNKGTLDQKSADVDTVPPVAEVTITPDGKITVTYPDDVDSSTITEEKIIVEGPNGPIEVPFTPPVKQPDGSYVVTGEVPPGVDGNVTVTVPTDSYEDESGNPGEDVTTTETPVDTIPPKAEVTITPDGKITVIYPDDVNPDTIEKDKIVVEGPNGPIEVPFTPAVKQPDGSYVVTGEVPPGVDGDITVTVPTESYEDKSGNPGEEVDKTVPVDNIAPEVETTQVVTTEDQSVTLTWAHFGISDANTANDQLVITVTNLPKDGVLTIVDAAGNKTPIIVGQTLSYADINAGKVVFAPDTNEASATDGGVYAGLEFNVSDGKHVTSGELEIVVEAVADKPSLTLDLLDWSPTAVNLNIQTWNNLKTVTVDGKSYNLLQGNGNGMPADTLRTVFEYLTSSKNTTLPPASTSETTSLVDSSVATYEGVAITGYVYLEAGHTYSYKGKADDSGMLIIGNQDPVFVSWGGLSQSVDLSFTAKESGFYTFDFYMHNQAGQGNYDFQLIDQSHGDKISYYPSLDAAVSDLNNFYQQTNPSVEWQVSDLIQGSSTDKDQNGFHRPYFNLSGEVGQDISLGLLNTSLNDLDSSESLTLNFSGLVEGMKIYAITEDGTRVLLGTADTNGNLSFVADGMSIEGSNLVAIAPPSLAVTGNSLQLNVKLESLATEKSNGSTASSELEFGVILYPASVTNAAPEIEIEPEVVTVGAAVAGQKIAAYAASDADNDSLTVTFANGSTVSADGFYQLSVADQSITLTQKGADQLNSGAVLPSISLQVTDGKVTTPVTGNAELIELKATLTSEISVSGSTSGGTGGGASSSVINVPNLGTIYKDAEGNYVSADLVAGAKIVDIAAEMQAIIQDPANDGDFNKIASALDKFANYRGDDSNSEIVIINWVNIYDVLSIKVGSQDFLQKMPRGFTSSKGSPSDWIVFDEAYSGEKYPVNSMILNNSDTTNYIDGFNLSITGVQNVSGFQINMLEGVLFADGTQIAKTGEKNQNGQDQLGVVAPEAGVPEKILQFTLHAEVLNDAEANVNVNGVKFKSAALDALVDAKVSVNGISVSKDSDGYYTYQGTSSSQVEDFVVKVTVPETSIQDVNVLTTQLETELGNSNNVLPIQETVTATASFAMFSLESESLLIGDDIVFDLLADDNLGGNTLTTVNDFSIADQIDISSLLSDDATEANLAEFVTVEYDEVTDSAVISIDRDGTLGTEYESQDLVVLLNQTSKVELDDLINNNQIIY